MDGIKLGPIVIGVRSIEKIKPFYMNVFGIKIDTESENYLSAYLGTSHIELEEDSENRFPLWAEHNIGTYKNSEFIVPNMTDFLGIVKEFGGSVVSRPVSRPWGGVSAEVSDPDGNIFLVSQEA